MTALPDDDWTAMADLWRSDSEPPPPPPRLARGFARRLMVDRLRHAARAGLAALTIGVAVLGGIVGRLPADVAAATTVFASLALATTLWAGSGWSALWDRTPVEMLAAERRHARAQLRWAIAGLAVSAAALPYALFVIEVRASEDAATLRGAAVLLVAGALFVYRRRAMQARQRMDLIAVRAAEIGA